MSAFIDTNVLSHAQGTGAKSETARQVILAGGVIGVQVLNDPRAPSWVTTRR